MVLNFLEAAHSWLHPFLTRETQSYVEVSGLLYAVLVDGVVQDHFTLGALEESEIPTLLGSIEIPDSEGETYESENRAFSPGQF